MCRSLHSKQLSRMRTEERIASASQRKGEIKSMPIFHRDTVGGFPSIA